MLEVIAKSIACFLAVYGVIQMCLKLCDYLMNLRFDKKKGDIHIVITVKNQQDTIEGIVRSVVWKNLNNHNGGVIPEILIVDMGSTDDTPEILKRLHEEYDFIQVTDSQGYLKFLEKVLH